MPYSTINDLPPITAAALTNLHKVLMFDNVNTQQMTVQELVNYIGANSTGGSAPWTSVSANYTALPGDRLLVDTSVASLTISLPGTPVLGDSVELLDSSGTWATNNAIVSAGTNIQGFPSPLNLTISSKYLVIVFNGTEWRF